jgi:hypothetical protein
MKVDKFIFLVILFIIVLSFVTYRQFKGFRKSLSEMELPKLEIPETNLFPSDQGSSKEFISPDEKLKLEYSSAWVEMEKEAMVKLNQEMIKKGARILFFGNKYLSEKATFASLLIQEINSEGKGIEEIITAMKEDVEKGGDNVTITQLETNEKEVSLKAEYQREEGTIFTSREKVLLTEGKAYFIAIFSLDIDWPYFEKEAEEILNSAQITS